MEKFNGFGQMEESADGLASKDERSSPEGGISQERTNSAKAVTVRQFRVVAESPSLCSMKLFVRLVFR